MNITIKDVARHCNVSVTTVSRVINGKNEGVGDDTRRFILETIEMLGYKPNVIARSMVTKKTNTVAIVLPDICNPFFPELARGAEDYCNSTGYSLFLCNSDGITQKEVEYVKCLKNQYVDGIMFTTQNTVEYADFFSEFHKENYPFVLIERYVDEKIAPLQVRVDNYGGVRKAVIHLYDNGHRNIAMIAGPTSTTNAVHRLKAYQDTIKELGLEFDESLIVYGDYKVKSGYSAAKALVQNRRYDFTAIIASNDLLAFGVCDAIRDSGLSVPDDISVIGFDDISLSRLYSPKLSTVRIPSFQMGALAAEMLIDKIQNKHTQERIITLDSELIYRESVKKIN